MSAVTVAPQILLGDYVFNVLRSDGVLTVADVTDGWLGTTAPTIVETQRPDADGAWSGPSYYGNRPITLAGHIDAPTIEACSAELAALRRAFSLQPVGLSIDTFGQARSATVRCTSAVAFTWGDDARTSLDWTAQVTADDPRIYGDLITGQCPAGQDVTLTNHGDAPAPIYLHLDGGAITAPTITLDGDTVLALGAGYTLPAGHTLDISTVDHTVYEDGTVNRARYLTTRTWVLLEPGGHTVGLTAGQADAATRLTVTTRSAWL